MAALSLDPDGPPGSKNDERSSPVYVAMAFSKTLNSLVSENGGKKKSGMEQKCFHDCEAIDEASEVLYEAACTWLNNQETKGKAFQHGEMPRDGGADVVPVGCDPKIIFRELRNAIASVSKELAYSVVDIVRKTGTWHFNGVFQAWERAHKCLRKRARGEFEHTCVSVMSDVFRLSISQSNMSAAKGLLNSLFESYNESLQHYFVPGSASSGAKDMASEFNLLSWLCYNVPANLIDMCASNDDKDFKSTRDGVLSIAKTHFQNGKNLNKVNGMTLGRHNVAKLRVVNRKDARDVTQNLQNAISLWAKLKPPQKYQSDYTLDLRAVCGPGILGANGFGLLRGAPESLILLNQDDNVGGDMVETKTAANSKNLLPYYLSNSNLHSKCFDILNHILAVAQSRVENVSELRQITSSILHIADIKNVYCFLTEKSRMKLIQAADEAATGSLEILTIVNKCDKIVREGSLAKVKESERMDMWLQTVLESLDLAYKELNILLAAPLHNFALEESKHSEGGSNVIKELWSSQGRKAVASLRVLGNYLEQRFLPCINSYDLFPSSLMSVAESLRTFLHSLSHAGVYVNTVSSPGTSEEILWVSHLFDCVAAAEGLHTTSTSSTHSRWRLRDCVENIAFGEETILDMIGAEPDSDLRVKTVFIGKSRISISESDQSLNSTTAYSSGSTISNTESRRNLFSTWSLDAWTLYNQWLPSKSEERDKDMLIQLFRHTLCTSKRSGRAWFPRSSLHVFGSSGNMFGTSTSDIDMCLELSPNQTIKKDHKKKAIFRLYSKMKNWRGHNGSLLFGDINPIAHARVPIVKARYLHSNVECDICINNMLATRNTMLLRAYAMSDNRVRALGIFVKTWAKIRKVKQSDQGTLSSYAWILLSIAYCQRRGVVPSLQDERLIEYELGSSNHEQKRVWVSTERNGNLDTTFCQMKPKEIWRTFEWCDKEEKHNPEGKSSSNPSLGELIFGFFWFYGKEFSFKHACSTTKVATGEGATYGRLLSKKKRWGLKAKSWRISIEDPFEDWHDLGRVVNREGQKAIEKELERAADILSNGGTIEMLLDPDDAYEALPYNGRRKGKGKTPKSKSKAKTPQMKKKSRKEQKTPSKALNDNANSAKKLKSVAKSKSTPNSKNTRKSNRTPKWNENNQSAKKQNQKKSARKSRSRNKNINK